MSINVNDKNLGHATAYAYYKAGGGTMTETEFAEFMADFGTASQTAVEAAQAALASKNAAQTAATTATNKASEATTAATTATTKAGEASTSASTATSAKDTAVSASQTATSKATEATTAAATATSAATTATTAKDDAVSAKTAAQTAQTGAETAAASVSASAAQIATNTEDIAQLKSELTAVSRWNNEFSAVVANGGIAELYCYAKKGTIVVIDSSVYSNDIHIGVYDDNRNAIMNNMRMINGKIRFRATSDITYVGIYNNAGESVTITVTVSTDDLQLTNYYDKSAKKSGYISNGNVSSGYCHSDFIPVAIGETFIFSGYPSTFGNPRVFFYDENKNYIASTYAISTTTEGGLYTYDMTLQRGKSGLTSVDIYNIYYAVINMTVVGAETAEFYRNNVPDTVNPYGLYSPNANELFNASQKEYIGATSSSPINGKKIAYNGDSICESRIGDTTSSNGGAYAKLIADLTNGTYDNRGRGGGTLASGTSAIRQVVNDVTNMPNDADLICFEGGINDYWLSVPLGDYVENDYSGTLDITTVCGALESIFRQAKEKWVGKPICFVIVHKIKSTVYVANSQGYTFAQAREKMIGICEKYAIPYYDAFAKSGLNAYDNIQNNTFLTSNTTGTGDGCHPNEEGYKKYYVPQLISLFNSIMPRG